MALNYNHLFYFHVAALEGSVAAAAQRLGVTAATVSEQLRTLERSLGKDLFERTQSGLRLTDSGRITFEHTIPMFRLGDRLQAHFGDSKDKALPILRVGLSIAVSRTMTVAVVAPLFALDTCAPSIRTGEHVELLRELKSGGLDLLLSESSPEDSATRGLTATPVQRSSSSRSARRTSRPRPTGATPRWCTTARPRRSATTSSSSSPRTSSCRSSVARPTTASC
jgi:LysR family transcriptional activator of nhaA